MARPAYSFRSPNGQLAFPEQESANPSEAAIARSQESLLEMHEAGEIDWQGVNPMWAYESAWDDDPEAPDGAPLQNRV